MAVVSAILAVGATVLARMRGRSRFNAYVLVVCAAAVLAAAGAVLFLFGPVSCGD